LNNKRTINTKSCDNLTNSFTQLTKKGKKEGAIVALDEEKQQCVGIPWIPQPHDKASTEHYRLP